MLAFTRAIKFAFQNFWRNVWLSVVTVVTVALSVFFITLMVGVRVVADQTLAEVRSQIDLTVFFKADAAEGKILEVKSRLEKVPEVTTVEYVSKDQALEQFRDQTKNQADISASIDSLQDNPLQASLRIKPRVLEEYPEILRVINDPLYEKIVEKDDTAESRLTFVQKFSRITSNISRLGFLLSVIFALIAGLVVFNTIRITIYAYREEIGIMKLVGASNAFIRAPFIIESIVYALLASLVALLIIWALIVSLTPFFEQFLAGYNANVTGYLQAHFMQIFGPYVLFALVLSMFSSGVAVGRYLRI